MTNNIENLDNIIAKNLKITYKHNDMDYLHLYPINSNESQDILTDVVILIDERRVEDFRVELSKPFLLDKSGVYTREALKEDFIPKLDNNLGIEKSLKLTK